MQSLFVFFIERWRLAFAMAAVAILLGALGAGRLNRESFPSIQTGDVVMNTIYPGSSAVEADENVAQLLEEEIRSVVGIKDATSISEPGRSRTIVRVDIDRYDVDEVVEDIENAVGRAGPLPETLPADPLVDEINSAEFPILKIALFGPEASIAADGGRQRDRLADELAESIEFVESVARVDLEGYADREFQILASREALDRNQVGIREVVQAVRARVQDIPAGNLEDATQEKLVRLTGQVTDTRELENIVIRSNFQGYNIRVKDVARVVDASEERELNFYFNGQPATALIVVKKESGDTIQTVDEIAPILTDFRERLPDGYELVIYDDEAKRVYDRLMIVIGNAVIGFVLVLVFLLIFFPGSTGLVTSLSLPLAIFATIGMMPFFGANFNTITMMALVISLGLMVDNAIVVSENYIRLRHQGLPPLEAAKQSVIQFWLPITATALTTIAAFVPMMLTLGVMGQVIASIPVVVTIALSASLIESFILLPARLRFTMRKDATADNAGNESPATPAINQRDELEGGWFGRLRDRFEAFVHACLRMRYLTMGAITALLAAAILVTAYGNQFEIFPQEDVEIYTVKLEAAQGTPAAKTAAMAIELADRLVAEIGSDKIGDIALTVGTTQTEINDSYAKYGDHTANMTLVFPIEIAKGQKTESVLKRMRSVPGGDFVSVSYLARAAGPPVGKALDVTISGPDFSELVAAVADFKQRIGAYEGVFDVLDDNVQGADEITFAVDYPLLARVQLSNQELGLALRTALEGEVASTVNADGEEVDIRVRYSPEDRVGLQDVARTSLADRSGNLIPVGNVARLREAPGPAQRKRYEYQRAITVSADVDNVNMTSVRLVSIARELQLDIQKQYPEIRFDYLGQAESSSESVQSLMQAMGVAVIAILLILVFLFDSYRNPLIVLSTIPLGLVGVSFAFYLHSKPFSFFALVGIVGLAGVVVNAAILLVSYAEVLRKERPEMNTIDLLARATSARLKPVMVTTLTTVAGLLPTAYGLGGYDPVLVPLTLAMAWGLISGTLLALLSVACSLAIFDDLDRLHPMQRVAQAAPRLFSAIPRLLKSKIPSLRKHWKLTAGLTALAIFAVAAPLAASEGPPNSNANPEAKPGDEAAARTAFTLEDTLRLALRNGIETRIQQLELQLADGEERRNESQYAPVFSAGYSGTQRTREENGETIFQGTESTIDVYSLGLSKRFATGTQLSIEGSDTRFDSNAGENTQSSNLPFNIAEEARHTGTVTVSLRQELLRNAFGYSEDRIQRIRRNGTLARRESVRWNLSNLLAGVTVDYWRLSLAEENIQNARELLRNTTNVRNLIRRKAAVGGARRFEVNQWNALVNQAENNYERLLFDRDVNRRSLARRLQLPESDPRLGRVPVLRENIPNDLELSDDTRHALESRPDLRGLSLEIKSARLGVEVAENSALPSLSLGASYAAYDEAPSARQAFGGDLSRGIYPESRVEFRFEAPLWDEGARTDVRESQLRLKQLQLEYELLEQRVRDDLMDGLQSIRTNHTAFENSRTALQQSRAYYLGLLAEYRRGRFDSVTLKTALDALIQARNEFTAARLNFNIALLQYDLVRNRLFEQFDLDLETIARESEP